MSKAKETREGIVAKAAGFKPLISEIIFVMPPKRLAEYLRRSRAKLGSSFESRSLRQILKQLQTPITASPLSDTSKKITEPVDFATARSTLE